MPKKPLIYIAAILIIFLCGFYAGTTYNTPAPFQPLIGEGTIVYEWLADQDSGGVVEAELVGIVALNDSIEITDFTAEHNNYKIKGKVYGVKVSRVTINYVKYEDKFYYAINDEGITVEPRNPELSITLSSPTFKEKISMPSKSRNKTFLMSYAPIAKTVSANVLLEYKNFVAGLGGGVVNESMFYTVSFGVKF